MENINNIIKFYRDCYQFDSKGIKINNFFSRKCEHLHIPDNFEFLNTKFDYPVPTEWGREVEKTLMLDSKEKALYAGSIFVKAKTKQLGKKISNVAPLYIHEINLICTEEVYFAKVIDTYINPVFVDCINTIDNNIPIKFDSFVEKIPIAPFGIENLRKLEKALKEILPQWDLKELRNLHNKEFDNLEHTKKRKVYDKKQLYSSLIFGILIKPIGSRGVISELTKISKEQINSGLVYDCFSKNIKETSNIKSRPIHVPASLSAAQKDVFYTMDSNDISLVIGPPGTGKSYTIAALAIDSINNNKSVLIASKNNQAGKVIIDKIENDFGLKNILIKTERSTYKKRLIARLNKHVYGILGRSLVFDRRTSENRFVSLQKEIDKLIIDLIDAEDNEMKWGKFYFENRDTFFTNLRGKWIEYQKSRRIPVWKINNEIKIKQNFKIKILKRYVKLRFQEILLLALIESRKEFLELIEALKELSGNALEKKFDQIDFNLILKALPAWVCNTQDISKILPLKKELFDIVIIDEASQCDIATIIPLLYRAKKIIVVGDPNQLRHYSFLSNYRQRELKNKYNINEDIPNYRKHSILDWINKIIPSQNQLTFLNEHYRSSPDLIAFSNRKFYDNHMKIMKANPHNINAKSNVIVEVNGIRNYKGVNEKEAKSVINKLREIIEREEELSKQACSKIGILSPFNSQTKYIKSLVRKSIDSAVLKRHGILIGTPYHFQGEERDIMLISFSIDDNSHPSVYNYLNKADVFNVSITRARNSQFVFTSLDIACIDIKHLIGQYLLAIKSTLKNEVDEDTYFDQFSKEVMDVLRDSGLQNIYKSTYVSGVEIDIAVVHNDKTYSIDLIGYPGDFSRQFTPENIQMLNRMSHSIFFLPYSSWILEKEKTIQNLLNFLSG